MADPTGAEILAQFLGSAPGATDPNKPKVYWGQKSNDPGAYDKSRDALIVGRSLTVDDAAEYDWAINQFYTWNADERAAWGQRLYKAGLIQDAGDYDAMLKAWKYAVDQAGNMYTHGGHKITPHQFIDLLDGLNGDESGVKTTRNTQTQYQIPSATEAAAGIRTIFQEALGRDPTDGELARYRSMWIGQARKNPATTTTTSTTDMLGNTTSSSTTSGGFDPSGFLPQQVEADPEYGAYQAATTYFNMLQEIVGQPL